MGSGFTGSPIEQRRAERIRIRSNASICARNAASGSAVLGTAEIRNISQLGACVITQQTLRPGQPIELSIATESCPAELGVPKTISGMAWVKRVDPESEQGGHVGVAFAPALAQSSDLAFYLAYLFGLRQDPVSVSA
jgi:hypothetical protein